MDNRGSDNSQSGDLHLSIRLFCGVCGMDLKICEDNRVPGNPNAVHPPVRKAALRHGCRVRPITMKDVIKHVVIGVSDEVFAADAIDKTAGKIQVYFQRKIEGAKKNALRGRGIIEEECDRYRDIFAGEKGNEEIEPLLKISPAKGNYFADHISVPPSKREVVQSRNSNDYIEWGRDLVNGAEYYMNRLAWSQEGLRQFLLTRIIPGEKRDSGRYSLGSFIEDIVDRVNVFDDYIDIIFLPVDECAESNGKPGLAREWRKRMPLANPV